MTAPRSLNSRRGVVPCNAQPFLSPVSMSSISARIIAGPAVAMILADLGAKVVHIDPPSGPLWNSLANAILNRNKLTVPIDLKKEKGIQLR